MLRSSSQTATSCLPGPQRKIFSGGTDTENPIVKRYGHESHFFCLWFDTTGNQTRIYRFSRVRLQ